MSDYISREDTINKINERQEKLIYCFGSENDMVKTMDIAKSIIIAEPPANVALVVHSQWVLGGYDDMYYVCEECGHKQSEYYTKPTANFCPNCGAKMDGGVSE
ncbi:MAG: hypothetical protein LIR50_10065 [Bacillota bacterium]|nr:hypothetical protein [Bacillota bacterium]